MASRAKTTKSKDTQAALKTIEKHLDAAAKAQKALHAECGKDTMNKMACTKHYNSITKELDKAQAEHRALIRALELREQRQEKGKPANGKKQTAGCATDAAVVAKAAGGLFAFDR